MTRLLQVAGAAVIAGVIVAVTCTGSGRAAGAAVFALVASQTPANGELNYNGASKGQLVITVPVGAAVQLTLSNKGSLPHSLQIIPYTDHPPAQAAPAPVFPGAETKNPAVGIVKGQTAVAQFTASKPGKYLLICGFPGHALLGMYGVFNVSPSASAQPSLVINK
jgi:sulfocyanin